MKDKQINLSDYNKIAFVDASGDDGFKFDASKGKGSTDSFVVSCLVMNIEDFTYNCGVLNRMKDTLNLDHNIELKSTTMLRHRFKHNAYQVFTDFRGQACSFIALKHDIANSTDPHVMMWRDGPGKQLSGLIHVAPFITMSESGLLNSTDRILVVIDHLKKTESIVIDDLFRVFSINQNMNCTVIYRDSKSVMFPLIQLSDVVAGTVRQFVERLCEDDLKSVRRYCTVCQASHDFCSHGSAKTAFKKAWRLFTSDTDVILRFHMRKEYGEQLLGIGLMFFPLKKDRHFKILDCHFRKSKSRR